ncbi:tetratricopeptide (TPR) repeat protein [Paenibacillus phyllosphaerae]|uniref:Tetratricopeptide (TPR) repeat protein n=1 Tax=Paenibacillus phyllosphaerae TaxID=274593 RepID=A0A7W5AW23_9BACL|nr:tetratricopeptide repeat protein [Paenibacillus phyllosphaerae]MBB3109321.1 tetratricopeptide (TPR) repeat protein [Paenibacillus phyllosphaerae]
MFQHVFATMHELLDDIMSHYGQAGVEQKKQYFEQLSMLKSMSDTFIEEWLTFEEKLAEFRDTHRDPVQKMELPLTDHEHEHNPMQPAVAAQKLNLAAAPLAAAKATPNCTGETAQQQEAQSIAKGQGYFKLFMFKDAALHFEQAVAAAPEDNRARLFLAMTYMHLQDWPEAQRHFQLLVELTDHPKWRALGYNALGCIQAIRMNLEQAERYFLKAHETDPGFTDPLSNLKSCQDHKGHLSLYFGSGQL